ncbi:MAG: hypothetical protein WDZ83_06435 [Rhizobiaceae bacterium]
MLVEITNYYAKPGMAGRVLEHRRRGSRIRVALGLEAGEIFVRQGDKGPDVRWECKFPDEGALAADLAARDLSAEFAEQRKTMSGMLERFERHVFALDPADTDFPPPIDKTAAQAAKELK